MKFIITDKLKMGDLRKAESSNSAGMELMARHAYTDEGVKMEFSDALLVLDEMDMMEFATAYTKFVASAIPNQNGTR